MRRERVVSPQSDHEVNQMMFLTLPVLVYQLLFIAVLYVASRLGRIAPISKSALTFVLKNGL